MPTKHRLMRQRERNRKSNHATTTTSCKPNSTVSGTILDQEIHNSESAPELTVKASDTQVKDHSSSDITASHHGIPQGALSDDSLKNNEAQVRTFAVSSASDVNTRCSSASNVSQPVTDVGVHEELFATLNPDDVLEGTVSIETMDYVTQMLKAQFPQCCGLYIPSCIYALSLSHGNLPGQKLPRHIQCVQIHFIQGHFLVSLQQAGVIYVYDSLWNNLRVQSLKDQLSVVYEHVHLSEIQYCVPQSQGSSNLCAMFATANALTLLMGNSPNEYQFDRNRMRQHLWNCLRNGHITCFPCAPLNVVSDRPDLLSKQQKDEILLQRYFCDQNKMQQSLTTQCSGDQLTLKRKNQIKKAVRKKRQDLVFKDKEKKRDRINKANKRLQAVARQTEREQETQLRKQKRKDDEYSRKEKNRETPQKRRKRKDEEYLQKEKNRETPQKKHKRKDEDYHQKEKNRETLQKKEKRKEDKYCQRDNETQKWWKKQKRKDEEYHQKEKNRETLQKRQKRNQLAYKTEETERETLWKSDKRKCDERFRFMEKSRDSFSKKAYRKNPSFREKEKKQDKCRKQTKRKDALPSNYDELVKIFHAQVSEGPLYVCTCCEQTWYKTSVVLATSCVSEMSKKCYQGVTSFSEREWLCKTCHKYLKQNKMPPLAIANGMSFPPIPEQLQDLHPLEERLVSPRIPFMKIFQAPRGGQHKLLGNVVNVPCSVINTVSSLPRLPSDDGTIRVSFKRRLTYTSSVINQNVRPNKVKHAAEWLVRNGSLYRTENITLNENWQYIPHEHSFASSQQHDPQESNNQESNPSSDPKESPAQLIIQDENKTSTSKEPVADPSDHDENERVLDDLIETEEAEIHGGSTDTMFSDPSFLETDERDQIWSLAPGQHNHPVSIFKDFHSEELSFPSIFCGQARPSNKERETKVFYSDIVKSELRRQDRRVTKSVDNIFFKTKKVQMHLILGKVQIAIRKFRTRNEKLTAGFLKEKGAIQNLCHLDEGYRVFRTLRGSPPYFEQAKKDLFAMIRHLGPATFFLSFSAAETHWKHLLKILSKTVDGRNITDDEIDAMSWMQKCHLIQRDPVTCSRHFHHSVQTLLTFLHSTLQPLGGNLKDFFYRVEYQHRGSPHIHMLAWVDDAPQYSQDETSEKDVTSFVDRIISCSADHPHSQLQLHRHSRTCRKGHKKCRFNFPQPPMRETLILHPIEDPEAKKENEKNYKHVKKMLEDMKCGSDTDFDQMLCNLSLTEEQYLLALRSSVSTPTVFLKRKLTEIRINPYISVCLSAWQANMDAQYIMDIYSCAMYVVGYISKSQRGISMLLDRACHEAREQASNIREQVRIIGNKFANNVEISAQEAVDICLQMPLRRSSRKVVFIPTSPQGERTLYLKSLEEISKLDDDSEEIAAGNVITRYETRNKNLEDITLADWVSLYDGMRSRRQTDNDFNSDNSDYSDHENDCDKKIPGSKRLPKKRKVPRVLRYVRYNQDTSPEHFYRERLLLFTSWRNEDTLMGQCSSYQERYLQLEDVILPQLQLYEPNAAEVDLAEKQASEDAEDQWDQLAPNTQHANQTDLDTDEHPSDEHIILIPPHNLPEADIAIDMGIPVTAQPAEMLPFHEMPDQEHRELIRSLNLRQREFFSDIMFKLKVSQVPVYAFLSGGAGVGKSRLLTAIYQSAMKFYNSKPGTDLNDRHVLVVAPTGKAAFNVHGNTIQSVFKVLPNQSLDTNSLTSEKLNTLRSELGSTKLIIIDEISMVGLRLFNLIQKRLQDIKGSSEDFAGVSVLCFGDLFQFKPVFDCFLFSNKVQGTTALATNLWNKHFKMYELTEIMRQKDCVHFAELLNRLREGNHTEEDIQLLETRLSDSTTVNYPMYHPHLFLENSRVDTWNHSAFVRSKKPKQLCKAHDVVVGDVSPEVATKIKRCIPDKPSKTMQLHSQLNLGIDLHFEICININTADGLTNGASGIVKYIQIPSSGIANKGTVWLNFDSERVGKQMKADNKQLYHRGIGKQWVPILPISRNFKVGRNAEVMRTQFPIRPSAAKTLHRAQGETFTKLVVDFSVSNSKITKSFFEHAHYVGLSRVTNLDGLCILDLNKKMIGVNEDVIEEMKRLRCNAAYLLATTPLYKMSKTFIVCYNNARSLHKHHEDIMVDPNLKAADICVLSETRFRSSETSDLYPMTGFQLYRNDEITASTSRPAHGTAVYAKATVELGIENIPLLEITTIVPQNVPSVTIFAVYKYPSLPDLDLSEVLNGLLSAVKTPFAIIIGDMNVDLNKKGPLRLLQNYTNHHLGPTTDSGTSLDQLYSNLPSDTIQWGVHETYWSDHKIIWAALTL